MAEIEIEAEATLIEDRIVITRQELEDLVQAAVLAGWRMGTEGQDQPRIQLDWIDGQAKAVRR